MVLTRTRDDGPRYPTSGSPDPEYDDDDYDDSEPDPTAPLPTRGRPVLPPEPPRADPAEQIGIKRHVVGPGHGREHRSEIAGVAGADGSRRGHAGQHHPHPPRLQPLHDGR